MRLDITNAIIPAFYVIALDQVTASSNFSLTSKYNQIHRLILN